MWKHIQSTAARDRLAVDEHAVHEHDPPVRADDRQFRGLSNSGEVGVDFTNREDTTVGCPCGLGTGELEGNEGGEGCVGLEDLFEEGS